MGQREMKQFTIYDKESCLLYLLRIITTAEKCLTKLQQYNSQTDELLNSYKEKDIRVIPYEVYSEIVDKTSNVHSYILNIFADAQKSSISYFKYRKMAKRLIKQGNKDIKLNKIPEETDELLLDFNKIRNWHNHIPESLLNSEKKQIEQGKVLISPFNPIEIYEHNNVTYDYLNDLNISNKGFYEASIKIFQACIADYEALIGEKISITHVIVESPIDLPQLEATKESAKIQGIKGYIKP